MYEYKAAVLDIHDGDTIRVDIDLGCDTHERMTLRLMGINAPELSTASGPAARDHLASLLGFPANTALVIRTVKDRREKYGRYLAYLWRADEGTFGPNSFVTTVPSVNDRMVTDGFAVVYLP